MGKQGGARDGAGRHALPENLRKRKVTVTLPPWLIEAIKKVDVSIHGETFKDGNLSRGLRELCTPALMDALVKLDAE